MDYPKEWDELSRKERRKKIKELKEQKREKKKQMGKIRNYAIGLLVVVVLIAGYAVATRKTPEQREREQQVQAVSLEGKVEEFDIEGREHVPSGTVVDYKTNPPTSGGHLAEAESWGVYDKEIDDKAAVHSLEHGGIWISYNDISDEEKALLEELGRLNPGSVIISPRSENDDTIVVASWGKMMRLESVDQAVILKYIETYKNQSPEKLAK
ncbi:DUF3105 domain-containing protein [Candidatus Roizmanbacteria bacterium]|nr:DUF3105 domain-containing protein [Candidatus Roizmanbacteria bacterium]